MLGHSPTGNICLLVIQVDISILGWVCVVSVWIIVNMTPVLQTDTKHG